MKNIVSILLIIVLSIEAHSINCTDIVSKISAKKNQLLIIVENAILQLENFEAEILQGTKTDNFDTSIFDELEAIQNKIKALDNSQKLPMVRELSTRIDDALNGEGDKQGLVDYRRVYLNNYLTKYLDQAIEHNDLLNGVNTKKEEKPESKEDDDDDDDIINLQPDFIATTAELTPSRKTEYESMTYDELIKEAEAKAAQNKKTKNPEDKVYDDELAEELRFRINKELRDNLNLSEGSFISDFNLIREFDPNQKKEWTRRNDTLSKNFTPVAVKRNILGVKILDLKLRAVSHKLILNGKVVEELVGMTIAVKSGQIPQEYKDGIIEANVFRTYDNRFSAKGKSKYARSMKVVGALKSKQLPAEIMNNPDKWFIIHSVAIVNRDKDGNTLGMSAKLGNLTPESFENLDDLTDQETTLINNHVSFILRNGSEEGVKIISVPQGGQQ